MKRDFLKGLGIEDADIISKILDENSADIGRAKGELQTYKDKVTDLEGKNATLTTENTTLKGQLGELDTLKTENTQLKTDKTNLTNELNTKVLEIKKDHAIEGRIRDRKGKNVKAIKALLDREKITYENEVLGGIDDQLDALASAEDSSMLFGDATQTPSGTHAGRPNSSGGNNPPTSKTFAESIAKALGK